MSILETSLFLWEGKNICSSSSFPFFGTLPNIAPCWANLELILHHWVLTIMVFYFGHYRLLSRIGSPCLKASHLREVLCCFRRRWWESCHTCIHYLASSFTRWETMIKSEICETCLPLLPFWLLKTWCIWSSLYSNALIILLVSDTVTWTQSPSGGSPSIGLHPLLLRALTSPNWVPWGLSVIARTGLCRQCCWCYPLSSGHASTACTHCCPRLHYDVCSYLQSWTGK